ncbi:hypothetical protein [Nitrosococcus halophilus]|nr:hypothetical protein [Nitrosococcus halophilus]
MSGDGQNGSYCEDNPSAAYRVKVTPPSDGGYDRIIAAGYFTGVLYLGKA